MGLFDKYTRDIDLVEIDNESVVLDTYTKLEKLVTKYDIDFNASIRWRELYEFDTKIRPFMEEEFDCIDLYRPSLEAIDLSKIRTHTDKHEHDMQNINTEIIKSNIDIEYLDKLYKKWIKVIRSPNKKELEIIYKEITGR